MEKLTARTFATNHFNRTFQALSKNVSIRADIVLSALETFLLNALYTFTYLLTFLSPDIYTVVGAEAANSDNGCRTTVHDTHSYN